MFDPSLFHNTANYGLQEPPYSALFLLLPALADHQAYGGAVEAENGAELVLQIP